MNSMKPKILILLFVLILYLPFVFYLANFVNGTNDEFNWIKWATLLANGSLYPGQGVIYLIFIALNLGLIFTIGNSFGIYANPTDFGMEVFANEQMFVILFRLYVIFVLYLISLYMFKVIHQITKRRKIAWFGVLLWLLNTHSLLWHKTHLGLEMIQILSLLIIFHLILNLNRAKYYYFIVALAVFATILKPQFAPLGLVTFIYSSYIMFLKKIKVNIFMIILSVIFGTFFANPLIVTHFDRFTWNFLGGHLNYSSRKTNPYFYQFFQYLYSLGKILIMEVILIIIFIKQKIKNTFVIFLLINVIFYLLLISNYQFPHYYLLICIPQIIIISVCGLDKLKKKILNIAIIVTLGYGLYNFAPYYYSAVFRTHPIKQVFEELYKLDDGITIGVNSKKFLAHAKLTPNALDDYLKFIDDETNNLSIDKKIKLHTMINDKMNAPALNMYEIKENPTSLTFDYIILTEKRALDNYELEIEYEEEFMCPFAIPCKIYLYKILEKKNDILP